MTIAGFKIVAHQQTMSGQNGVLTSQKFHPLVMLTSQATLIVEYTAKPSSVNLRFSQFVKIQHLHQQKITQGLISIFSKFLTGQKQG